MALGKRPHVTFFGNDYPTPDGTCIRDYVHVDDLCEAHVLALKAIRPGMAVYNVGIGRGYSVQEVLAAARVVTGHPIPAQFGPRRPGDPPAPVCQRGQDYGPNSHWQPKFTKLEPVIETAWRWFRAHPSGYG